ncbi:hypothetical protein TI39_contig517g00002 [Zymoseptoria brevis]|uniref:Uncharacterized protein n=1 Tax=Zymoseptoria brevis TaxID=1047168 RepID=A0A0F4GIR1_9PEZI|nr:hypothetical protein TI39_contig517g00002 [Zymoseptoria brevis]
MAPPSSPLLSLPLELREQVYAHALTLSFFPPTRALRVIPPTSTDHQLYNWTDPPRWQPLPLLLVSHQIRHETLNLITRLESTNSLHATLDIFTSGSVYTPKWTLVNLGIQPASRVNLHVNLTIVSGEAFHRDGGGGPGAAFKSLLHLLNRFIFDGPTFLDYQPPRTIPGPFYIDTLSVHVAFQDDYTPNTWTRTWRRIFGALRALAGLHTAGRYLRKVQASTAYEHDGEVVEKQVEWVTAPGNEEAGEGRTGRLSEADWAAGGFPFGEEWLKVNRPGSSLGIAS